MVCKWSDKRLENTLTDSFILFVTVIANGFAVSPYEPGLMLWWRLCSFTGLKYSSALSSTIPGPSGFGSEEMERNKLPDNLFWQDWTRQNVWFPRGELIVGQNSQRSKHLRTCKCLKSIFECLNSALVNIVVLVWPFLWKIINRRMLSFEYNWLKRNVWHDGTASEWQ